MARVARGIHQVHINTDWQDVPVLMDPPAVARVLGRRLETVRKALSEGRLVSGSPNMTLKYMTA